MRLSCFSGMPTPRSCTRTQTVSGAGAATDTVTCTWLPEYFTALSSRLVDDGAQLLGVAADDQRAVARRIELDGARLQMMARRRASSTHSSASAPTSTGPRATAFCRSRRRRP